MMQNRMPLPARVSAPVAPSRAALLVALAAVAVAGLGATAPAAAQAQPVRPACTTPVVQAAAGAVCGTTDTTTVAGGPVAVPVYRGIPYAVAPTPANGLRWRPTQPLARQDTTLRATAFGLFCPQPLGRDSAAQAGVADTLGAGQSEDCLFLNVWTPPGATAQSRLPVMVFIHGGAFVLGHGSAPVYNGAYLAAADTVVVVTLNYRLGALGFLYSMAGDNRVPGNLGLLDQQTALQWVRRNIGAFGGDSSRVTLFGESAGAMSVGFHLFAMPGSDSLFRAAIMESNPMGAVYRTRTQAQEDGSSYIQKLCGVMGGGWTCDLPLTARLWFNDHAQQATTVQVMEAQRLFEGPVGEALRLFTGGLPQALPWTPTVDGQLAAGQPLDGYAAGMRPKPYVFGFNRDEGVVFAAFADTILTALEYGLLLDRVFLLQAGAVRAFSAGGVHPYDAARDTSVAGMEPAASALSDLMTDMVFKCANLASADAAYTAHQQPAAPGGTAAPPIFGYLFQRSPVPFMVYPGYTECSAARGTVCHADELPYVFNTLDVAEAADTANAPVTDEDRALARQMAAAWGRFAKRPGEPPASGWTPYAPGGGVYSWSGAVNGPMVPDVATTAHCTDLWFRLPPLRNVSAAAAGGG